MSRCLTRLVAVVGLLAIAIVAAGCSQSTSSGQKTNTGVLTGYEMGNEKDFTDGRRDRLGYRDFD
ncbi:MAG: hypothetical protein V3S08_06275 [Phycisphaerales bacterium]